MTASYSGTHGPSQGDCKSCNSRVKQWGVMGESKGQTVDFSLDLQCETADLGYLAVDGRRSLVTEKSQEVLSQSYL